MIKIRKFQPKDFGVLLELANQAVPFAPHENQEWFEYRQAFDETTHIRHHYITEASGQPVGYGGLEQQSADPQELRIFIVCKPADLLGEIGDALYDHLLKKAQELSARKLWARELQDDGPINEFLRKKGFLEKERFTLPKMKPMVVYSLHLT